MERCGLLSTDLVKARMIAVAQAKRFRPPMALSAGRFCLTKRHLRTMTVFVLLPLAIMTLGTQAQAQAANEYQVKAAFIFNFAKFIDWPADAFSDGGAPLYLCIVGNDPFGSSIDRLINGNSVDGHRMITKRFKAGDDLRGCHILFISSSEQKRAGQIMQSVRGVSVLTIGDTSQFTQQGGVINFVIQENKVRFEINAGAAGQARLKISSKLMALARGRN
jgi:hypothetical protein